MSAKNFEDFDAFLRAHELRLKGEIREITLLKPDPPVEPVPSGLYEALAKDFERGLKDLITESLARQDQVKRKVRQIGRTRMSFMPKEDMVGVGGTVRMVRERMGQDEAYRMYTKYWRHKVKSEL